MLSVDYSVLSIAGMIFVYVILGLWSWLTENEYIVMDTLLVLSDSNSSHIMIEMAENSQVAFKKQ